MLLASMLLALAWAALHGEFSLSRLVTGATLGYVVLWLLVRGGVLPARYGGKVWPFLRLAGFLAWEAVLANIRMAVDVVRWRSAIRPGIVAVPLDAMTDAEILWLAALINLTPGSVALDVSADRSTMYVHVMHVESPEAARLEIKDGFERRILELLR